MLRKAGFLGVCSAYGGWNCVGADEFHIQRIHGDPSFSRIRNWMTYDPRLSRVRRFDESVVAAPETTLAQESQAPVVPTANEPSGIPTELPAELPASISQPPTTHPSC